MRRDHRVWIGPVVTFAGAVSYFTTFSRFAFLRDFPWLNLPIVLAGVVLSALGARNAFRSSGTWRKLFAAGGLVLSTLLGGLFCLYVFFLSYLLPAPTAVALGLERVPELTLPDHTGRPVALSGFRGRKLVVTFYRGHW
jgi:hypothetical protein